jgi:hypothetical protein
VFDDWKMMFDGWKKLVLEVGTPEGWLSVLFPLVKLIVFVPPCE